MSGSRAVGAYAVVAVVLAVAFAGAILAGPFRAIERSDYMTYHVAARIVMDGNGDCLYDPRCQAEEQRELIGPEPSFERGALPYNSPPWLAAVVAPLGWLPLPAGFAVFTLAGLAVLAWAAWRLAPGEGMARVIGPILLLSAWPTVMGVIRGQSTLLVAGLLALSVASTRYRSGVALGLSALKPTLGPLWALWQLTAGHPRAVATALAALVGLVGIGLIVVGPAALAAYPAHLLGVAGEDALGVHPAEMVNWRGAAERLGTGPWLAWAGSAATMGVVGFAWLRTRSRQLGAAAAFLATPLVLPHANQHEAVLGALGVLILIGLSRPGERPAQPRPAQPRTVVSDARASDARAAVGAFANAALVDGAVASHAVLWSGPALDAATAAWLIFALLLAWLLAVAWRAATMPR